MRLTATRSSITSGGGAVLDPITQEDPSLDLNFADSLAYSFGWFPSKVGLVSGAIKHIKRAVTADFTTPSAANETIRPNKKAIVATVVNLTMPKKSTAADVVSMEVNNPTVKDAPNTTIPVTSSAKNAVNPDPVFCITAISKLQ